MVQREYHQRTPRIVYIHASERLLHVRRIVTVGEDHAFRIGGRAGGIGDGGVIIVAQRLPDRQELLYRMNTQIDLPHPAYLGQRHLTVLVFRLLVEYDDLPYGGELILDRPDFLELLARYHDIFHVGVDEAEQEVVRLLQLDG